MNIIKSLAEAVAKDIFELGNEPDSPCHRIEFKGGKHPNAETAQGGMCLKSLADNIEESIKKRLST